MKYIQRFITETSQKSIKKIPKRTNSAIRNISVNARVPGVPILRYDNLSVHNDNFPKSSVLFLTFLVGKILRKFLGLVIYKFGKERNPRFPNAS